MEIYRDLEDCMIDRQSKGERVKDRYRNYENKSKTERESMRYTETQKTLLQVDRESKNNSE